MVVVAFVTIVDAPFVVLVAPFAIVGALVAVVGTFVVVIVVFLSELLRLIWHCVALGRWGRCVKCGLGLCVSIARYYKRGNSVFEWVTLYI